MNTTLPLDIAPHIKEAIQQGGPVVALESTIITHGMEYPTNVQTALQVEQQVRLGGGIPATIAIISGRIKVGVCHEEIEYLGKEGQKCKKCSRRDLSDCLIKKQNGSTTVSATMICANLAGIKIFVTGGIGGVHRGAETTFDISTDLIELGQTQVVVVSSGAKSILDIPKTLEYLETQGVPVVGYKTDKFPEFFISDSGFYNSTKCDSDKEIAELIYMQFNCLNLQNGILVTVPIPQEQEADGQKIKNAVDQALKEAKDQQIGGSKITPYLLKRINEITEGHSSNSNIALIKNNAFIGGKIAKELALIQKKKQ
ncbi:indigoidine synthase a family protein, putative [Ichthyophthirius multifiliis]|uniref:Indigoidine synthase a family protein, putative n=1 Tax=Ichthyophthirius multifiliis TaxID=5932 RepID=G0QN58_ICHMU|nr:indigoidine synthase a family protein, putative [Ichthyophthirius multifiliis]EGR33347.1 indigoidine synthase a family protein, putative [Ichthyophthirius multifiliis]|eukprot:XP_004037333.1 indigoidine synthase a family protein, putative [Ichthyophthirius multifiliis]